jgi:hypothetical protein
MVRKAAHMPVLVTRLCKRTLSEIWFLALKLWVIPLVLNDHAV